MEPSDGTAESETVQGEASLPSCVRRGQSAVPAAQEQRPHDPQPGGSQDTRGHHQVAAEFSGSVRRRFTQRQEAMVSHAALF